MRAGFWPGTSAGGIHASVRCVSAIAARSTGVTMDHGAIRNSPHGTVRLNQGDDMIAPSIVEEVYAVALLGPAARASARRRVYPAAAILGDIEGAERRDRLESIPTGEGHCRGSASLQPCPGLQRN